MRKLRGLTRLEEVARRIVGGWEEAYEGAKADICSDAVFGHRVQTIELPYRQVTEAEVADARREAAKFADDPPQRWNYRWHQGVVERYEAQQAGTEGKLAMELHVTAAGGRGDRHQRVRTLYRLWRADEGAESGCADVRHPACRLGGLPAKRAGGARWRLWSGDPEQPHRPRGRPGACGPDVGGDSLPVANPGGGEVTARQLP